MLRVTPCGEMSILERLRSVGVFLESPCNGNGLCGKCKVKILNGKMSILTEKEQKHLTPEEIDSGIRLACMAVPKGEVEIDPLDLYDEKENNILCNVNIPDVSVDPVVTAKPVTVRKPSLENGWSICEAMGDVLAGEKLLPLSLVRKLPNLMDEKQLWAICYYADILDLRRDLHIYGLAVDIGTTTVAVSLINLCTGTLQAEDGFVNPQKAFGLDVLSRIHYDMENPNGVLELQRAIVQRLQQSAEKLAAIGGIPIDSIYEIVVSGNSTMLHSLLGVPVKSLGVSPYSSVFTHTMIVRAEELGFNLNRETRVYCIPSVSTYIGGDIVAGALTSRIDEAEDTVLFMDIGTNGEMILSRQGKMYSCSCAAGPALEGMNISCGMRAETGAVEHVTIEGDTVSLKVIGNSFPRGLCGSGLLEAVGQAVAAGAIGKTGRISSEALVADIDRDGKRCIVLDRDHNIYLTQNDIRQVQFCKGAILSGILTLLERLKLEEKDVDRVIVAGQFGKHLNPKCLTEAKLIPTFLKERIVYIGNSSLAGAQLCLLSKYERLRTEQIAKQIDYIELSISPGYEKLFSKCLQFGDI